MKKSKINNANCLLIISSFDCPYFGTEFMKGRYGITYLILNCKIEQLENEGD